MFDFRTPVFLFLLAVIPFLVWLFFFRKRRSASAPLGDIGYHSKSAFFKTAAVRILYILAWMCGVIALSGPRAGKSFEKRQSEGVDIMIALDVSGSMSSVDVPESFYKDMYRTYYHDKDGSLTNRLTYAKMFTKEFISKRKDDRIGLVVFAGYSYTRSPLTFDHSMVLTLLQQVNFSDVNVQSTAIGLAIANGVQRLTKSSAKSKIVILITDGSNNAGEIDPMTAADIAKTMGVKVYTIGVGSDTPLFPRGRRGYYVKSRFVLDEKTLKDIASKTGGQYFRVKNPKTLSSIFDKIDAMEKSMIEKRVFVEYKELFQPFLIACLLLIAAAGLGKSLVIRQYP